jgi:amino acid transporter
VVPGPGPRGAGDEDDAQGRRHVAHHRDDHHDADDHERRPSLELGTALRTTPDATAGPRVPPSLVVGFAVASIGGPLALAAIYIPAAADMRSAGLFVVVGALLFACPLLVWLRYSKEIASAGGLAAFVEASAGHRLALLQAAVWTISYFLYLPYTITDIVYEQLADVFPGIEPWRWVLEITLPVGIVALVLAGTIPALRVLFVSAAVQLAVVLAFGVVLLAHVGAPGSSFTHVPSAHPLVHGSAAVALLFLCASLVLFLGGEAVGGARTIRYALVTAFVAVAVYLVFAIFPLALVGATDFTGLDAATRYGGRSFGILVGLGAIVSVAGVIVAEYIALSRLLFSVTGVPVRRLLLYIAVPFVAIDALSVINPHAFDHDVLQISLSALFLAQLIVFAVYPLYRRNRGRLTAFDLVIATVSFALMAWGLWRALSGDVAT